TCPPDAKLVELVEGRLDGAALARLKEHVAGCGACAGFVEGLRLAEVRAVESSTSGVDLRWARDVITEDTHGRNLATPTVVPAGSRIAGRFVIEAHAGSGGMSAVYRAHDEQTDHPVALKLLKRGEDPDAA